MESSPTEVERLRLTELEAVTLAYIRTQGGCTAYQVRRSFQDSPTARFSASAGAIYPLLRRLEGRGLLKSREQATGQRRSQHYRCTRAGLAAVRAWLTRTRRPDDCLTQDPVRTEMLFLDVLTPAARRRWLDEMRTLLDAQERRVAEHAHQMDIQGPFAELAHDHARREIQTRREWLRHAQRRLGREGLLGN